MADKTYKTGILIVGDSKDGVKHIKLTADEIDKLAASQNRAKGATDIFSSSTAKMAKQVVQATAAVAAAGAAIIAYGVKSQLEAVDKIAKVSDAIGIQTEALIGLQHAASLAGTDSEQLTKGLISQQKAIAEAADGVKTYTDTFDRLGLNVRQLAAMAPEDQFSAIADALDQVENSTQRTALAADIYGKRNVMLLNTLALGSQGLREYRRDAELLGLTLSRETAAEIERANDAIERMTLLGAGMARVLTAEIAPALADSADAITNYFTATQSGESTVSALGKSLSWLSKKASEVAIEFLDLGDLLAAFAASRAAALRGDVQLAENIASARREARAEVDKVISALWNENDARLELITVTARHRTTLIDAATATDLSAKAAREAEAAAKAYATALQSLMDQLYPAEQQARKYREQQALLNKALADGTISAERYADANRRLLDTTLQEVTVSAKHATGSITGTKDAIKEVTQETDVWAKATTAAVERIDEATTSVWRDLWAGNENIFKSFAKSIKEGLIQLMAELSHIMITRPLIMRIGAAFGLGGGSGMAMAGGGAGGGGFNISSLFGGGGGSSLGGMVYNHFASNGPFGTVTNSGPFATTTTYSPLQQAGNIGLNAVAGYAGAYAGGAVAGQFTDRQAESPLFATIGGIIGSATPLGPLGTFIGAAIGSAIDTFTGSDFSGQRVTLGVGTGGARDIDGYDRSVTGSSGLELSLFSRRANNLGVDRAAVDALLQSFVDIDSFITATSARLGNVVNLSGVTLDGMGRGQAGFYGSFAKGEFRAEDLKNAPAQFVKDFLAEISAGFDEGIRPFIAQIDGTVEDMLRQFGTIADIQNAFVQSTAALEAVMGVDTFAIIEQQSRTLFETWKQETASIAELAANVETAADYANLTNMVVSRYETEIALIKQVNGLLADLPNVFSGLREQITLDQLGTDANRANYYAGLYNQAGIDLANATSPEEIARATAELERTGSRYYSYLTPEQKAALGPEILQSLQDAEVLAESKYGGVLADIEQAGQDQVAALEAAIGRRDELMIKALEQFFADEREKRDVQIKAEANVVSSFGNSVNAFGAWVGAMPASITVNFGSEIG